jgi:hypothetical protein
MGNALELVALWYCEDAAGDANLGRSKPFPRKALELFAAVHWFTL